MAKMVKKMVMRVECLVRSEFTVPGWTEFTVTSVPVTTTTTNASLDVLWPSVPERKLVTGIGGRGE